MGKNIADLEAALASKYSALASFYNDSDSNANQIAALKAEIHTIQISLLKSVTEKENGEKYPLQRGVYVNEDGGGYDLWQGVHLNPTQLEDRNKALDIYEALTKRKLELPGEGAKPAPGAPPISHPKVSEYRGWERRWVQEPIRGQQWYNNQQVAMLTGRECPVGKDGLSKFLDHGLKNAPLAFSYLKVPDKDDPSLNHFVSIYIEIKNNKPEVTYLDSNGETISPEDERQLRTQLKKRFKEDAEIVYRGQNGEKVSQGEATQPSHKLLRVQFDGHNCGMFSTEFTALMKEARGDEAVIKAGIERIKATPPTPDDRRKTHETHIKENLKTGRSYKPDLDQQPGQRLGVRSKL
jgi:hypothetical protein